MKNTSPLSIALRLGSVDEVREVLATGVNPNHSGDFHISSNGFEQKIEILLEHGWEINRCQLVHDAKHGMGKRVEFYLDKGADPNMVDGSGQNALHKFAFLGIGAKTIQALIKAGVDCLAKDMNGDTPLELARRAKRQSAFNLLETIQSEKPVD